MEGDGEEWGESWQVYLNIRLCHTWGSADNFITSTYKNDCRVMQIAFAPYTRLRSACRLQGRGDLVMKPGGRRAFVQFNRISLQGVILPSHSPCIMESSDLAFQAWGGSGGLSLA